MAQDDSKKLHELIDGMRFAMLTTIDEEGALHSRPMAIIEREFDGDLWFFTSTKTHKVSEVERDHHVNVAFAEPKDQRFVSVAGLARVVRDRDKLEELWSPMLKAFFPDGLDSPDLALLHIEVRSAEYWDAPSSKMVRLAHFARAIATGRAARPGEHEKLDLGDPEPTPRFH